MDVTSPDDLLRAILADPANDDLRLVFADLLDDRGEGERSEFIRVQCKIAEIEKAGDDWHYRDETFDKVDNPKYVVLRRRERELWGYLPSRTGVMWELKAELPGWGIMLPCDDGSGLTHHYPLAWVRRGFIADITCTYDDWARHADSITARCPIERVVLTTEPTCEFITLDDGSQPIGFAGRLYPMLQVMELVRSRKASSAGDALLRLRWPRIAFTLPSEVAV